MKLTKSLSLANTNVGGWALSRHYPHLLCWSWTLWFTPHQRNYIGRRFYSFAKHGGGEAGGWGLALLWLFEISFNWQSYPYSSALRANAKGEEK